MGEVSFQLLIVSIYFKFFAFVRVVVFSSRPSQIVKFQLQPLIVLFELSFIGIAPVSGVLISSRRLQQPSFVDRKVSATADISPIQFSFYWDRYCFGVLISSRRLLQPSFAEFSFKQLATRTFSLAAILPACYCFVLPALLCCNVIFIVICFAFH